MGRHVVAFCRKDINLGLGVSIESQRTNDDMSGDFEIALLDPPYKILIALLDPVQSTYCSIRPGK